MLRQQYVDSNKEIPSTKQKIFIVIEKINSMLLKIRYLYF